MDFQKHNNRYEAKTLNNSQRLIAEESVEKSFIEWCIQLLKTIPKERIIYYDDLLRVLQTYRQDNNTTIETDEQQNYAIECWCSEIENFHEKNISEFNILITVRVRNITYKFGDTITVGNRKCEPFHIIYRHNNGGIDEDDYIEWLFKNRKKLILDCNNYRNGKKHQRQ